jgi:chromosome segregation ATPase
MQISISKQGDELKKHWSEIRKLWGVANDTNKGKITKNQQDIAFLASKRNELEASIKKLQAMIEKESKTLQNMSANYFGLSADIEALNEASRNYRNALSKVQASLNQQGRQLQNNSEAIKSVDGFRRQINQKLLLLEQRAVSEVGLGLSQEVAEPLAEQP